MERKISPEFSCIKFFQIWDVPTQIPGHPGHSLSKTTEKGHWYKVLVQDIPTSGRKAFQPDFGAYRGLARVLFSPSNLQKEVKNPEKGHFYFLRPTLVCTKLWFKRDLIWIPDVPGISCPKTLSLRCFSLPDTGDQIPVLPFLVFRWKKLCVNSQCLNCEKAQGATRLGATRLRASEREIRL